MPYERQLKERQIYNTLSIFVELMKFYVNLKFRLKYHLTLSIEDVFKESNVRTVPCAYATPTSNGLLENLIQVTIKTRNKKGSFKRHIGAPKFGISGYCSLILSTFSVVANLLAYVRINFFVLRRKPVCFKCP